MNTVAAADADRVLMLNGAAFEGGEQCVHVGEQQVSGADKLDVEAGVEHVGGGHALMDEARFRPDMFGQRCQEGDNVVFDLAFDLVDALNIEAAPRADGLGGFFRDDAQLRHCLGGQRFDFLPDAELRLRRPDFGHLRAGITWDHCRFSVFSSK